MRLRSFLLLILASLLCMPRVMHAQGIRGVVVDGTDRPVSGVVVQLLDSASAVLARALSSEQGTYRLVAPRAGTFRIRTLRIGYRASVTEPFVVQLPGDITKRIALTGLGVSLDTLRVIGRNSCRLATDSSAATFAVWEQIRTALTAAEITGRERIAGTTYSYERTLDADDLRLLKQRTAVSSSYINQPWQSLSPQQLRKYGYVTVDTSNATTYYAPGIDVLLSPIFLEDHCFNLKRSDGRLGITFEPAPERQRVAEIRGTLWLDEASSELRNIEYSYVHITPEQEARAKGDMSFIRMRDGTWAIAHWTITMPVVEAKVIHGRMQQTPVGGKPELKVYELIVRGGDLVLARRGVDTVWAQPPRRFSGVVKDSSTNTPVENARVTLDGTALEAVTDGAGRFQIEGLLPGRYLVEVRTPSLDSLNALHQSPLTFTEDAIVTLRVPTGQQVSTTLCGATQREFPGIVMGSVSIKDELAAPRGMSIGIEWTTGAVDAPLAERGLRMLETKTNDHGAFRFCGVPIGEELTLRTLSDTGSASPVTVRIPPSARFARASLEHDYAAHGGGALIGVVVGDSTNQPIAGAQIAFPEIGRATVSAANGVFRLNDIPAGTHKLQIRRVGFSPLETTVSFFPNQTIDRRVVLSRAVVLETVVVSEWNVPPEFEESRKLGMGSFVTRDQIEKMRGMTTMTVMQGLREMRVVRTAGGHAYIVGARPPHSGCTTESCLRQERLYYVPDLSEKNQGIITSCYSQVYLDRMLLNPGRPTEPFDIGTIPLDEVEAIEFYPTRLQTPLRYDRGMGCGVVQIWTHRAR